MRNVALVAGGDPPFYRFARVVCFLGVALPFRVVVEGDSHLPERGGALLAVNHKCDADPVFVGLAFRRALRYIAKAELFRHAALRRLIESLGAIPVRRGESDRHALETALACLARGEAVMIFPEGTRFRDEEIHEFMPGVGMLALRSGVPVIPVALRGTSAILGRGRPRAARVRVKAGPPVDLTGLDGPKSAQYATAAGRMRDAVRALYASTGVG